MKIAITTTGDDLTAPLDGRFGRSPKYLVYDLDRESFEVVDNSMNRQAAQGAGIQAAQTAVKAGAQVVITGHCGPKAFQVLEAAGVMVYTSAAATVQEALDLYRRNELTALANADVMGHWS